MTKRKTTTKKRSSYDFGKDEWTTRVIIYGGITILLYAGFLLTTLIK